MTTALLAFVLLMEAAMPLAIALLAPGFVGGPKGREGLGVRQWVCGDCGANHDRDINAALNIARLGCETLCLKGQGSPVI